MRTRKFIEELQVSQYRNRLNTQSATQFDDFLNIYSKDVQKLKKIVNTISLCRSDHNQTAFLLIFVKGTDGTDIEFDGSCFPILLIVLNTV